MVSVGVAVAAGAAAYRVSVLWLAVTVLAALVAALGAVSLVRPPSITVTADRVIARGVFKRVGVGEILKKDLAAVGSGPATNQLLLLLADGDIRRWGTFAGSPAEEVASTISRMMGVDFVADGEVASGSE